MKVILFLTTFCGSATTGVSALRPQRKFIGIDSEKEYLDNLAIPRLSEVLDQIKSNVEVLQVSENNAYYDILP